jgi:ATP-binding cassette subfamily B protein
MNTPAKKKSAVAVIRSYMARYRRGLLLGAACLTASNLFLLVTPWILKLAIDSLRDGRRGEHLLLFASLLVASTVMSGIFRFLMRRIMIGISRKIEFDLRRDFFAHLEAMSPAFYLRHRTGDLMALATNDLNAVRSLVGPGVMYSLNTIVTACFAVTLMVVLSLKLTLIALLPMILLSLVVYNSVKAIHRLFEKVQERFSALNSFAQENLSGIRVVKAYAREEHQVEAFEELSRAYVKHNMKLFKVQSLLMPMLTFVAGLGALIILGYGGKQVIDGNISLGAFVAFHGYLAMLIWPMIAIGWVMNITQRGLASMERIMAVLDIPTDTVEVSPEAAEQPVDSSIRFEGVSFTYPGSPGRKPALEEVSISIGSGETAAIVGPTGSGKSALVSLIVRMYEPDAGEIYVGGVPVRKIPLAELRRLVGIVPQEIILFSDTIRENIAFGVSSTKDVDVERAAEAAAIREEVEGFPRKFDSLIGERGINLSGGQKQRVAIARAIACDPRIFIMDDALSSVDTETEAKILASLRSEMKKRTSIIISHRISTVQDADRIFVLDDGRIVEQGRHEDLVALGGIYARMYRKQALARELDGSA